MDAAEKLAPEVGTAAACRQMGVSRATVYATLLDEGTYHCSIRTMYRILHDCQEVRERRNQLRQSTPMN